MKPIVRAVLPAPRSSNGIVDAPPSRLRLAFVPIASVVVGSMLPSLFPVIANSPILPPFGLLLFLGWRLLRPDIWPAWVGVPLGFIDDLFSGQPIGSAMALWTLASLGIDAIDRRLYWRGFWQDWGIAVAAVTFVLGVGAVFAMPGASARQLFYTVSPQALGTFFLYPLAVRLCGLLDRWRLKR